jgi:hypothetical protein
MSKLVHMGTIHKIVDAICNNSPRLRVCALFLLILLAAAHAPAEVAYHSQLGYWVDAPTNWTSIETGDSRVVAFTDPTERAIFQIVSYDSDRFDDASQIAGHIRDGLGATGEILPFEYMRRDAALADYTFDTPQGTMRGYFIFLDHRLADHAAFAYVVEDAYQDAHDFLLSAVDSFAPTARSRRHPGPVSAFLSGDQEDGWEGVSIDGPLGPLSVRMNVGGVDDNQVVIEREAWILSLFQGRDGLVDGWQSAWRRFYRMVYRDSVSRLEPLARAIEAQLEEEDVGREEVPGLLLDWIQGFDFVRTGSLSDLASPTTCVLESAGDCDGLGILYASILHYLGYDAILMVSMVHSHALVGVDVEGAGARFPFKNTDYLVAELTDDVDIGMIAAGMADPADWIGIELR